MIEINGKIYRNLQEQVEKNKDDIARLRKGIASEFTAGRGIVINDDLVISTNLEAGSGILFYNQPDNTLGIEIDMDEIKYNLATVASTGSYDDLTDTPTLATVATSGLYSDLSNKPVFSTGLKVTSATSGPIITIDNDTFDDRVQFDIEDNIVTDGDDNIVSLYGYGVGGGTEVIANPTGTASTPLNKIQIDSTKYYIPYTSVEVNNTIETGDSPLNSIEVDGDNYYVREMARLTLNIEVSRYKNASGTFVDNWAQLTCTSFGYYDVDYDSLTFAEKMAYFQKQYSEINGFTTDSTHFYGCGCIDLVYSDNIYLGVNTYKAGSTQQLESNLTFYSSDASKITITKTKL